MFLKFEVDVSYFDGMYVVDTIGLLTSIVSWSDIICSYVVLWYSWGFKIYKNV